MRIKLAINTDVQDCDDEETEERIASIAQEEARKFVAALGNRLEAEGFTGLTFDVDDSED